MVQVSGQFQQLVDLDPILTDIFYLQYAQELGDGSGVMPLYNMTTSSKAKETDLRIGSFTDPVEFTGQVEYHVVQPDYEIEYVHTEFAKGFQVERKLNDDMQYDGIFRSASEMGAAFGRKRRKDGASTFNNAFSASFPGYDGVSLVNASHPISQSETGTTVSNTLALALNSANLETAVVQMQDFGDDLGEEITILPDVLVVPRALRKTAIEVTASPQIPENANNAINVQAGNWTVIVDPYLTDSNAWFIVDSSMSNRYLKWYDRIMLEFGSDGDFDTFIRKYRGYNRYSFGWSDWRWILGSNPS
jgi:phage major head subunit gpT-like protein